MALASASTPPPLLGDGKGNYRVHIVGNSGVGKSTVSKALASILEVPYISLDALFWNPGWVPTPPDEFEARIRSAMGANPEARGWVIDGNYVRKGAAFVAEEATDIIWLDPPLLLSITRLILRAFMRVFGLEEPAAEGCPDSLQETFLARQGLLWWTIKQHKRDRDFELARLERMDIRTGTLEGQRKMRRLGGWGGEVKGWLRDIEVMIGVTKRL